MDLSKKTRKEGNQVLIYECRWPRNLENFRCAFAGEKFSDQSLNDEQIKAHGNLCRVEELNPEDFE